QRTSADPQLERQVETIRNLVESYMLIVTTTLKDMTPKMIMGVMINHTKLFIAEELLAMIYAQCDINMIMEESDSEAQRRDDMIRMYNSLKEGLKVIGDINVSTVATSAPPPVDNSWISESSAAKTSSASMSKSAPMQPQTKSKPPPTRPSPAGAASSMMGRAQNTLNTMNQINSGMNQLGIKPSHVAPMIPSRPGGNRPPPVVPKRPAGSKPPSIPSRPNF
ncbi:unnamed protein product, partial [Oikopleura dioica]